MKSFLAIVVILSAASVSYSDTVIRPNLPGGFGPDITRQGLVIKQTGPNRYTVKRELLPGSGQQNMLAPGIIIRKVRGKYIGRRELVPASGFEDFTDPGFTIESNSFGRGW